MNPLSRLHSKGQSFWLDYIQRSLMSSGELAHLIKEDGLRGMTSNPTIFQKAISTGDEYDAILKKAALKGKFNYDIFEEIAIQDIQKAADVLKTVYKESDGADGFVSLEVNPNLAFDTDGTIQEARKLWKKVNRPNLMIKVPATKEGLSAVQQLLIDGINVNVTLLFSVSMYKEVLDTYMQALEKRAKKGKPIKNVASVASFFVSRVDTIINKQLDPKITQGESTGNEAKKLLNKIAVANAKLAYEHYLKITKTSRYITLQNKGARPQRLLWASTGAKDKRFSDVVYVDELIGPDTVNTMPPQTADAFKDHGQVEETLTTGFADAHQQIEALENLGISLDIATQTLQTQGVKAFVDSFDSLLQVIGAKREEMLGDHNKKMKMNLGSSQPAYISKLKSAIDDNWVKRIWAKNPALWKSDESHQAIIKNALGWLTVPQFVSSQVGKLNDIAKDIKKGKFTHALLLGMGGSSLCPEVLRITFGKKSGYPDMAILDSTEPASVAERAGRAKPEKTLFIVASKSGSTTEPNAFLAKFYDLVKKAKGKKAGENFVAITDPGTSMEKVATEKKFRHIVLNPSDIGGRYSALSFFGMVPAAIMGIDVQDFIQRALRLQAACSPWMAPENNPGLKLGIALGTLANEGRDKLTFILSPDMGSFSTWVEQLIAESTGKEGKGILPVESEAMLDPKSYQSDRVFVYISTKTKKNPAIQKKLTALAKADHPIIEIEIDKKDDIAGEFFRWEFATAVAGAVMGINPFDQPNVQEAKDLTKQYLKQYQQDGCFENDAPFYKDEGMEAYSSNGETDKASLNEVISSVLSKIQKRDYVAILAYIERNAKNQKNLQELRTSLQKITRVATTVGFGPRFLHSTGQLHKGGDNNGVFISVTADDPKDVNIPGAPYSFSILKEAQARGDWGALKQKDRRAVHLHFHDLDKGLAKIREILKKIDKK
jgi:transaldolase/glucose-6-phosphate isomerase